MHWTLDTIFDSRYGLTWTRSIGPWCWLDAWYHIRGVDSPRLPGVPAKRERNAASTFTPVGLLRWLGRPSGGETDRVINSRSGSSAPSGYRFPREVIAVAVRWYLRYGLSYRDVEELLAGRGIEVDPVRGARWGEDFPNECLGSARPAHRATRE